jgi:hypothetical protein
VPRRQGNSPDLLHTARQRFARLLDTPLHVVARKLESLLAETSSSGNTHDQAGFTILHEYIIQLVDNLPQTFQARFNFDAAMIKAVEGDWSPNLRFSNMMIPRHQEQWGHQRLVMPSEDRTNAHVIDLIHLRGRDSLEDIDLLSYPLLIHELGHYILLQHDQRFIPSFGEELQQSISQLRLAGIADRGAARTKAQKTVDEIKRLWTPTPDQHNWSHELTIDLIALWTCGPAYLDCFLDIIDHADLNPYQITKSHPPYAIRASALVRGAAIVGLTDYAKKLAALQETWRSSRWRRFLGNRYVTLARQELVDACINLAFSFCTSLGLAQCTREQIVSVRARPLDHRPIDVGLDLILWAWSVFDQYGSHAYDRWQSAVVKDVSAEIMR